MKDMLMMHAPRGTGDWAVAQWAPEDLKAHIGFMKTLDQDLRASGELVAGEGLAGPADARVVRAGKNGAPEVTDGPFPEAKEFLAGTGLWTWTARSAPTSSLRVRRRRRARGASRSTWPSRCAR